MMIPLTYYPGEVVTQILRFLNTSEVGNIIDFSLTYNDIWLASICFHILCEREFVIMDSMKPIELKSSTHAVENICSKSSLTSISLLEMMLQFKNLTHSRDYSKKINIFFETYKTENSKLIRQKIFELAHRFCQSNEGIPTRFSLFFCASKNTSWVSLAKLLRKLGTIIILNTGELSLLGPKMCRHLRNMTNSFPNLKALNIDSSGEILPIELGDEVSNIESLSCKSGGLLKFNTALPPLKHLSLQNVAIDVSGHNKFSNLLTLRLNNTVNTACLVSRNEFPKVHELHIEDTEIDLPDLNFQLFTNLKCLNLINVQSYYFGEITIPQGLTSLVIEETFLPLMQLNYASLPTSLKYLDLKTDYQFNFSSIKFPINLKSLAISGGYGDFNCRQFICPPFLEELKITGQNLKSSHKLRLPKSLRLLDLTSNNIYKISGMKLPDNIRNLNLSYNHLTSLENSVLPIKLEILYLHQSESFGKAHDLRYLINLKFLYLNANDFDRFRVNDITTSKRSL
ncbi:Piso0_005569 [Millerozyma farinosa CBS 7064]|uniref:Piso0_005569 protein n=1 Tax=Pichia sorbitophila (strain ATCC MYA-4447 / BCRC 22081 / CBS 7064 / NBRC 10061 / NRRL Y-12695) TaxID=559304 RepID=G8XZC5_PICSO|nr:Piso0_005569 [Millerozyma farinosa CBS 7064]